MKLMKILKKIEQEGNHSKEYNFSKSDKRYIIAEVNMARGIWTKAQAEDLDKRFGEVRTLIQSVSDKLDMHLAWHAAKDNQRSPKSVKKHWRKK